MAKRSTGAHRIDPCRCFQSELRYLSMPVHILLRRWLIVALLACFAITPLSLGEGAAKTSPEDAAKFLNAFILAGGNPPLSGLNRELACSCG